ncbi:hypothetical protein DFH29DRAFT_806865, partial [Suillus ampliporus]
MRGNLVSEESDDECNEDAIASERTVRKHGRRSFLRARFDEQHNQFNSHVLRLREKKVIPVLLGDAIPRSDRSPESYECYCRAMMMLFKPWRDLQSLKGTNETWSEAFETETFEPRLLSVIRNMNIETECKDARDTHAAAVREERASPHKYGNNATEHEESQEDMIAFNDALLADPSLALV